MKRPWTPPEQLEIRRSLWRQLLTDVAERGRGTRESGAFLLAAANRPRVIDYALYDDLDPDCLVGSIAFSGKGFSALWDLCDRTKLRPVADLHTHPSASVRQSPTDRAHPMIALPGHIALIAPEYLTRPVRRSEIGVHVYRGDGWHSHHARGARRRLRLVRG